MKITLNGKVNEEFDEPLSVVELLEKLGFTGQPVLVELDEIALRPRDFENTVIGDGARVELVIHQVIQLQHVHVTDRGRPLKLVPRPTIEQLHLAAFRQISQLQHGLDLALLGTVENGGCHRHATAQVLGQISSQAIFRQHAFDGMCDHYKECGGTYYSTAQDCIDASINYWGECEQGTLDTFGDCMKTIDCADWNPDTYNPANTDCSEEWSHVGEGCQ